MTENTDLKPLWLQLMKHLNVEDDTEHTFDQLTHSYSSSYRHYHTLAHIEMCLNELCEARKHALDPDAIELAIWFHDYIYDTRRSDNEEQSAIHAQNFCLKHDIYTIHEKVAGLVLATKHDDESVEHGGDTALLIDIDLAILGQPREIFDAYEKGIRAEYRDVAAADFRSRRQALLLSFIQRDYIYRTKHFREKCEERARWNLQYAMHALQD